MSTGRRLAKRSIIGTKVCAPGPDGLWYSGVIQDVKTPPSSSSSSSTSTSGQLPGGGHQRSSSASSAVASGNSGNITPDTKYLVRFDFKTQSRHSERSMDTKNTVIMDARQQHHHQHHRNAAAAALQHISPAQSLRRNAMIKEFRETDLIGPGFRSIMGVQLHPGQRVYLTFNGRETSADVVAHDLAKDEVIVKVTAVGTEEPIELKKRLEEVRLLESRRSARLADQDRDTDFARLADMGGDRRRTSHSIDVPLPLTPQHNSRKRRPSYSQEERENFLTQFRNDDEMNACNAALVLMSLSCSPLSPKNADKWAILGSSPGSSSASWSSGSSSPPLSDDGQTTHSNILNEAASARIRTTSLSTSDEGIVMDYNEDAPRKRRANRPIFKCTWKGCDFIEQTSVKIERHIRNAHLGHKKARHSVECDGSFSESDHEEEFYYTEIEDDEDEGKAPSPPSPPTLSHRDMARPPHEDPEYQRKIVGNFKQGLAQSHSANGRTVYNNHHHHNHNHHNNQHQHHHNQQTITNNTIGIPTSPLAHHNYTWPSTSSVVTSSSATTVQHQHSPVSPMKHARWSPRPSTSTAPYPFVHHHHHHNYSSSSSSNSSNCSSSSGNSNNHNHNNIITHSGSNSSSSSNNSANNVLQQLSQQNVTVTTHHHHNHSGQQSDSHQQQQQQQEQLAHCVANSTTSTTLSITPNIQYPHNQHQQENPQQQHPPPHQHQMHHQPHNHHHHQNQTLSPRPTANNSAVAAADANNHHTVATATAQLQTATASTGASSLSASAPASASASALASATHHNNHHQLQSSGVQHTVANANRSPQSPNRRTRGENKKCRKVYGMDKRDQWCTQCKWKKACSRFGD